MIKKYVYLTLGFVCVGLAFFGVFIPGLPTTPFVLLAAWFFASSSKKFEKWLLDSPIFGKLLKDWRDYKGLSVKSKIMAVCVIIPTFSLTIFLTSFPVYADIGFALFALLLCTFLVTRPVPPSGSNAGELLQAEDANVE